MRVLVTGGAGFIGSHLVDAFVKRGDQVRVLDNLEPQVHGSDRKIPKYLNKEIEFIRDDIRDKDLVKRIIKDVDVISHQAAAVGVGQSMYEIEHYVDINIRGTAVLLEALISSKHKVKRLVVASSMSAYGEGKYECEKCGIVYPGIRSDEQLTRREWEVKCPECRTSLNAVGTDETKPLMPTSIYAISKRDQEEMSLVIGKTYGIPTVALRYFNIYGSRQALSNPYTGVAAIFSARILNGKPPLIFEDGLQTRDFIHVSDIVKANLLAIERKEAVYETFNVGTGRPTSILDVAKILIKGLGKDITPKIVNKSRSGDIRHCFADITKIKKVLGFEPSICFEDGVRGLTEWVAKQSASDLTEKAAKELEDRGLTR